MHKMQNNIHINTSMDMYTHRDIDLDSPLIEGLPRAHLCSCFIYYHMSSSHKPMIYVLLRALKHGENTSTKSLG